MTTLMDKNDPIKHVVLLMMENHSFDQMLGCFNAKYPDLEGVDPHHTNTDAKGKVYAQIPTTELQMTCDPIHEHPAVMEQLGNNNGGFIQNFIRNYPNSTEADRQNIMGYYPRGFLPALHALAEDFLICDHWFSSLPGPTWPNRFFALSGTCNGEVTMPGKASDYLHVKEYFGSQTQNTLFDRLKEAGRSWHIYYYDIPDSLLFVHQRDPAQLSHYKLIDQFFKDACGLESDFPDFIFIEPKYFGLDQNDDHPPHNVMKAEKLIADVYNAIRSNDALWKCTLLVILFDEHGGFYDHVIPPLAIPPDDKTGQYAFNQLGLRVPALLVSPWVQCGLAGKDWIFDHTSLLKYLTDKWKLGSLGNRTANANSIEALIQPTLREENDTVPFIRVPYTQLIPPNPELEKADDSVHHQALHNFAEYLIGDRPDEIAARGIADVGEAAGAWATIKNDLGKSISRLGAYLSRDLEDWHSARQKRTEKIVESYIAQKGKTKTKVSDA